MKLNRAMIITFREVIHGKNSMKKLAATLNKSNNRISGIIRDLEKEGFIIKRFNYTMNRSRKIIEVANTQHALKIKELIFQYPTIKFENILSDSKLLFLAALSEDWITIEIASELSKISKYMIDRYKPMLKNRGIIIKKNNLYKINEKSWPTLKEFLIAYKNYFIINGNLKWKYQNEILFEVDSEDLIQGTITGFARYKDYNLKVNVISVLCKLPQAKLSKEEIFAHSLFEVNDSRTLHLALTFYLKNKLIYKKILQISMRYGKYTMFENMIKILKSKAEKIQLELLPIFDRNDFKRIASIYGVKNV